MGERQMTDREQILAWQQEQHVETQAVDQALHYEALGVGIAVFCQTMFDMLLVCQDDGPPRFRRDEALALVEAAVRGR